MEPTPDAIRSISPDIRNLLTPDLGPSVQGMRRLLDALLPSSIELELATSADGTRVPLSKLRIERIVLNLVMNARDAMADGGKVTLPPRLAGPGEMELAGAGTGPGFRPR